MKIRSSARSSESTKLFGDTPASGPRPERRRRSLNASFATIAAVVLSVCLYYAYVYAFRLPPYAGITFGAEWTVTGIDSCTAHPQWCNENREGLGVH